MNMHRIPAFALAAILILSAPIEATAMAEQKVQPDLNANYPIETINEFFFSQLPTDAQIVRERYLRESEINDFSSPEVQAVAAIVREGAKNDMDIALAAFVWTLNHHTYYYSETGNLGLNYFRASHTVKTQKASCRDYATTLEAILNANDIATVSLWTLPVSSKFANHISAVGYSGCSLREIAEEPIPPPTHLAVAAYLDNRWIIIDPTEGDRFPPGQDYFDMSLSEFSKRYLILGITDADGLIFLREKTNSKATAAAATLIVDNKITKRIDFYVVDNDKVMLSGDRFLKSIRDNGSVSKNSDPDLRFSRQTMFCFKAIRGNYLLENDRFDRKPADTDTYKGELGLVINGIAYRVNCYYIGNNAFVSLDDICRAIDVKVKWDRKKQTITVDTSQRFQAN